MATFVAVSRTANRGRDVVRAEEAVPPVAVARLARRGPPLVTGAMLALALLLVVPLLLDGPAPAAGPPVPAWVLVAGFAVFELVAFHVPLGRDLDHAEELNLTEVVLVFGLFLAAPRDLVLAALAVTGLVTVLHRSQAPAKQAFNAANRMLEAGVALAVFSLLAPADPLSLAGWAAGTVAVVTSGVVSTAAVVLVVRCVAGPIPGREALATVAAAVPLSLLSAALGFVAVAALQAGGSTGVPLALALGSLLVVMRATTVLAGRHRDLAELHAMGERVARETTPAGLVAEAVCTSQELVGAREVTAYLTPDPAAVTVRHRCGPDGTRSEQAADRSEVPEGRGLLGRRLVSSAALADGGDLVLVATGRRSGLGRFRRAEARMLDLIAHRAGSDLQTLLLVERLRAEAVHDPLTGLPNRRAVLDAVLGHDLSSRPLTAAWIGLQGMQEVNAALGHDVGNELLREIGCRLTKASAPGALVGRTGGNEFVVLQLEPGPASPAEHAAALLAEIATPFRVGDVPVLVRGRAGVAVLPAGSLIPAEDVLRRADIAMRRAEAAGHEVAVYVADMETSTPARLTLASELQDAIVEDQLTLYAQPQQRLGDGVTSGVEVLVRWNHPRLGLVPPDQFLFLAASTGLDRPLTAWVVRTAIAALAGWRQAGLDLQVSVNVVPEMITDGTILELLEEQLARHPVPGDRITVEVVESGLLTNPDRAAEVLDKVTALGVRVSIDDFGTGFSSLSHLRRLPVQEIKIDLSFVRTMLTDRDDDAIVTALIGMGHRLGLDVVAEGIESEAILDRLRYLRCDAGQGFHLARPMPLTDLPSWVADHQVASLVTPLVAATAATAAALEG